MLREDFIWGAASASYQIEGAASVDGKGKSVWDMMCRKTNAIWENQNGNIACDHYHLYRDDIDVMEEIGLKEYRMSLSWPRLFPNGVGTINESGFDFYDSLVDGLLEKGIRPFVTLFHWDYPYELYKRGGWLNSASSDWFAEYVEKVIKRLSDRVSDWLTLNEPQCFIGQGHMDGVHAPGDKLGFSEVLLAGHNALLAHGKAVQVIRSNAKLKPNIGYAPVGVVKVPFDSSKKLDIDAARKSMFSIDEIGYWNNTWWMDPVFWGKYPEDGLKLFGEAVPDYTDSQMSIISEPVDFCGANIYNGRETSGKPDGSYFYPKRKDGHPITAFGWAIVPQSLYWGPKFLYERYAKPIVVTENGIANIDFVSSDNHVHDPQRIDFTKRYICELLRAVDDGVDVRGYFHWSLTDNFEWAEGFSKRFGLVFVDYESQERIIKDSAYWYRDVIQSNGASLVESFPFSRSLHRVGGKNICSCQATVGPAESVR